MNSRLLFAFLCVASLSTGCIIVDDDDCCRQTPPPAQPGNVTFLWTFNGLRCDAAREVYGVNIVIPGESLHNDGRYACTTAGVDGITLHDFVPGSYNFTIQGVDYRGVVIYEATGTFIINGNARVNVDLMPRGNPNSYAYLNWTFPGNMSCAQARVTTVDVTIDNVSETFPCADGQSAQGVQSRLLAPGEHYIDFVARDSSGSPLYYFTGGLATQAYRPINATYNLTAGGAAISWRFSDGSVNFECPSPSLMVGINFLDVTTNQYVYPEGDWHQCSTKPIIYAHLRPGFYKVELRSTINNVRYCSNPNIPSLEVKPNVFPGPSGALEVSLSPQNCQ
jgi:hypothetical protein